MIERSRLEEAMSDGWVMFDKHGDPIEENPPDDLGPAVLMVGPITDALKDVRDGEVVGSVARDSVARVRAIALHESVVSGLPSNPMGSSELLDAVAAAGFGWAFSSSDL